MRIAIFAVRFVLLLYLVLINLYVTVAYAEQRRVALVIGNGDYQKPLTTPVNDAQDMATALHKVDFDVILKTNADQFTMEETMVAFGEKLHHGVVGLFYYSGYAVQFEGENYLIPYGAMSTINVARHLRSKAVNLDYVLSLMENANNGVNIVILDACRANPFNFSKKIGKGLTTVGGVENMVIAYATSPGKVSPSVISQKQRNSFYTMHLLHFITSSNLPIELMLKEVRTAVSWETREKQKPWYTSSLDDTFKFKLISNFNNKSKSFHSPLRQPLYQVKTAMLTVLSNVDGTTLFINGKNYNFIPNGGKRIELPLGKEYVVQVQKEEYIQFTKKLTLKKDETVEAILHPEIWIFPPWN
jgi:hypothetical protein